MPGAHHPIKPPHATNCTTWTLNRSGQPYRLSSHDNVSTTVKEAMLKSRHLTTNGDSDWIGVLRVFPRSRCSKQLITRQPLHALFVASYQALIVISMRLIFAH